MDDLLEALFEVIIEIVFEGLSGTAKSKRVPLPLRILAALLLLIIVAGVVGLIVFCGIILIKDYSVIAGVVILAVAAVLCGGLVWKFIKTFRDRQNR